MEAGDGLQCYFPDVTSPLPSARFLAWVLEFSVATRAISVPLQPQGMLLSFVVVSDRKV